MSYACPKCDKTWASKNALNAHSAVHRKANLFTLADHKANACAKIRGSFEAMLAAGELDLVSFSRCMNVVSTVLG